MDSLGDSQLGTVAFVALFVKEFKYFCILLAEQGF